MKSFNTEFKENVANLISIDFWLNGRIDNGSPPLVTNQILTAKNSLSVFFWEIIVKLKIEI